ncbi:hypothetical protein J4N46_10325 [Capnocytophaga sp. Marseille-Q4570]|uniref:Immunity protein 52 domain-containing protein n=1 Tax=Capnocytophaga bilenii TaxID=2819369 RepID=A0ABS3Q0M6_9FLAO|nr:Imm52 family immunity protein [Capnocytophaga bilenii]MBO1884793.1 hypothetical protein [Capnocytophaga bilenii]
MKYAKIESISIIWGARKESIESITDKVVTSLDHLSMRFPDIFSKFYCLGNNLQSSLKQEVFINKECITNILKEKLDKEDEEFGTRIGLWNGKKEYEKQASCSAKLGSYSQYLFNNFVLDLPKNTSYTLEEIKETIFFLNKLFIGEEIKINGEKLVSF